MKRWFGSVGMVTLMAGAVSGQDAGPGATPSGEGRVDGRAHSGRWAVSLQTCQADADRLCAESGSGVGDKAVVTCLVRNREELERSCRDALQRARRAQRLRRHCGSDVEKLCAHVEPGERRLVACLRENESQLSPACQDHWARRSSGARKEASARVGEDESSWQQEENAGVPEAEAVWPEEESGWVAEAQAAWDAEEPITDDELDDEGILEERESMWEEAPPASDEGEAGEEEGAQEGPSR